MPKSVPVCPNGVSQSAPFSCSYLNAHLSQTSLNFLRVDFRSPDPYNQMNLPSGERWLKSSEFSMISHHLLQCCGSDGGEKSRDSRESRDRSVEYTGGSSRPRSRLREGRVFHFLDFFSDQAAL